MAHTCNPNQEDLEFKAIHSQLLKFGATLGPCLGAGELTQQLNTVVILAEDLDLVPSTMVAHNHP